MGLKDRIKNFTLWVSLEDDDEIIPKIENLKQDALKKHEDSSKEKKQILLNAARDVNDPDLKDQLLTLAKKADEDFEQTKAIMDSRLDSLQAIFDVKSGRE